MIIAVDFDGTIVEHHYPKVGPVVMDSIYWLQEWINNGAKIILHTIRSGFELAEATEFLRNRGVELYGINHSPNQETWSSSPKVYANLYVDDAAFGCPLQSTPGEKRMSVDWSIVGPSVLTMIQINETTKGLVK